MSKLINTTRAPWTSPCFEILLCGAVTGELRLAPLEIVEVVEYYDDGGTWYGIELQEATIDDIEKRLGRKVSVVSVGWYEAIVKVK